MRSFADADRPLIYAITDGGATAENFASAVAAISGQVREAVEENVSMVQIREKHLSGKNLFELASVCSKITRGSRTKLLVNDRADIAEAAGADGVHLTGTSIPTSIVRGSFGNELVIGVSVHTAMEAETANQQGADFAVFGPVFETPGKGQAAGIDKLKRVCYLMAAFPIIGLGGIDPSNAGLIIRAGAAGVAGIRAFADRAGFRSIRNSLEHVRTEQ